MSKKLENCLTDQELKQIFNHYWPMAVDRLKICGTTTDPEAISYAQEAIWNSIKTYEPSIIGLEKFFAKERLDGCRSKFSTYLFGNLFRRLGDYGRKQQTKKVLINSQALSLDYTIDDQTDTLRLSDAVSIKSDTCEFVVMNKEEIHIANYAAYCALLELENRTVHMALTIWAENDFSYNNSELSRQTGTNSITISKGKKEFLEIFKDYRRLLHEGRMEYYTTTTDYFGEKCKGSYTSIT